MNFVDKVFEKFGYLSKKGLAPYIAGASSGGSLLNILKGKDIDPVIAMQAYNGWVYACASVIGEEIAKTKFRLFKVGKDDNREEIFNHELLDQLNRPNNYQTGWEMKFLMGVNLVMVGKFYLYLGELTNEYDKPTGLYPLLPQFVTPIMGDTVEDLIKGYEYKLNANKTAKYTTAQVLCVRYPSPTKLFDGMGVVAGIPEWIDSDNFATEFNRKFFENFAQVGGYLESKDYTSPDMLDYMAKAFQEAHAGSKNAYKTVALPDGTKFTPAQRTQQEMDFINSSKDMRDKIMSGFRVPKSVLGLTEDVNRANAEATDYIFATRTIKPKLDLITEFFNIYLVPRYGEDLVLGYVDPTPENLQLEIQENQAALAQQAYKTVNEVREEHGLPPIANGNAVMTDFSKSPLGEAEKTQKKYKPTSKGLVYKKMPKPKNPMKSVTDKLVESGLKALEAMPKKKALDREQMQLVWKGLVSRVAPFEKQVTANMKKVNAEIFKQVKANISKIKSKAVDPEELYDEEEIVSLSIDLNSPTFTELYKKEGLSAAKFIGKEDFKFTPELKKALDKAIELLGQSYSDTTKELLKSSLEAAIADGVSIPDRIAEIQEYCDTARAEAVAKTETFRIANTASKESWKQNGITRIEWFTAEDELVCEFCGDMDGKVISVEENFFDKGDSLTVGDKTLDFGYSDIEAGSLHTNCRCITKPVVDVNDL